MSSLPDYLPERLRRLGLRDVARILTHTNRTVMVSIGSDGTVESAKLLGPPRTVNDGLFLSVAKAWLFQPALKDGVPVRYRKTIWVASP